MKKVREGYKMTELGAIPEEWRIGKLGVLSEIVRGASPRPKGDPKYYGGSFPRLMISDVTRDGKYVTPKTDFLTEEGAKKSRFMNKGDLVISVSGTVGLPTFLAVDSCIHDGFMGFKKIDEKLDKDYLYYEILYLREKLISSATDGGVYVNLTTDIVKNFDVLIPSINEQQKISLILCSVDEQIQIANNLIEKTKRLKKGLMQRLLTEGIGHSKFKETKIGRIPEEWEDVKLSDCVELIHGYQFRKEDIVNEGVPIIKIGQISENGILDFSNLTYIQEKRFSEFEQYKINNGDVLLALSGATTGKVALVEHININIVQNYRVGKLVPINCKIDKIFLYHMINSENFYNQLMKLCNTSAQPNFGKQDMDKINIIVPPLEEQKQIASILSSVDDPISQYESKKEKLQELKKGLMQKLLTGKIRVKV